MKRVTVFWIATFALLTAALQARAGNPDHTQGNDFTLTYHVERFSSASADLQTCGSIAEQAARKAGFSVSVQHYPGQLVMVSGGARGHGVFTVQCLAAEQLTVSVVQGIDYQQSKGALGDFADATHAAMLDAWK